MPTRTRTISPESAHADGKKSTPSMKVFQNFTSKFPEKNGERCKYQSKSKGFPVRPLSQSPETQPRTYWIATKMLPPDKTKTSKTKEKTQNENKN